MNRDYYHEYSKFEREHWWFLARKKIIESHLTRITNGRKDLNILNIGAATGASTFMLKQYGNVTSAEYDKECCDFLQSAFGITAVNCSVTDLPFKDNEFDLVCAFDVIEHVEDDAGGIGEMKRVCRRDGVVCITVPAFMSLWNHHDEVNMHFRRYTKNQVVRLFGSCGKIIFSTYFNFFLFIPIYLFRMVFSRIVPEKFFRSGAGSDVSVFEKSVFNKLLYHIMVGENIFIRLNFVLPFGVSVILSWKKE